MKKIVFVLFILPIKLFPQSTSIDTKDPANLDSVVYSLRSKTLAPSDIILPFKSIEVIDARYDTSKIGFTFNRNNRFLVFSDFKKMKINGGVAKGIEDYYNDYYQLCLSKSSDKLLIVLKKLWVDNLPSREFASIRNKGSASSLQDIHIKFEYYLHRSNDYFPLARIDTLHQLTEENQNAEDWKLTKNSMAFFYYSLKAVIEKYDFKNMINDVTGKKKLSIAEIDSFNAKRFRLPVLISIRYNEGLYRNVQEFIKNEPSIKEYKVDKKGKIPFNKDAKDLDYWAFADSNGLHLTSSKKVDLFRVGNTFEFFTYADFYSSKGIALQLAGTAINQVYFDDRLRINVLPIPGSFKQDVKNYPRQIDMETGEIY